MNPSSAPPTAEPSVTFSSGADVNSPPALRLLHYNDVYHLDASSAEPAGGIARFITVCKEYREAERYKGQPELVTLFSGDVFNPSLESSITKGSHMVPFLNAIGTQCACVGNHDLDFGVMQYRYLTSKCNFPWLLANVLDPALGEGVPLGNAQKTHMITASNGIKIGFLGLGEREWLDTINSLPPNIIYRSASEVARELVPQLRAEGADIIIALTHMREPNDNKLATQLGGENIDIILGGHDHFYAHSLINGTHVLRSGSDFKQLSYLEVRRAAEGSGRKWDVDIWRRDIVRAIPEDAPALELVDKLTAKLKKSLEKPVWGRFPQVSNINFTFDPSSPARSRILSAEIDGAPVDDDRIYVVATRGYMARGKDGFTSLLVQPEGGECVEVVSEENGVLISAMLRQYFMSLTVLAKWKRWGPSLDRHWSKVADGVAKSHPIIGDRKPSVSAPTSHTRTKSKGTLNGSKRNGWADWTPTRIRQRRSSVGPMLGPAEDESDSDSGDDAEAARQKSRDLDKQLAVTRRVFEKWCRLAGVKGKTCDELPEEECEVGWTRAIAPRVEGRIKMVTAGVAN
ncbi:hypothetical protein N0V88_007102 [Collariella sp. IMI 366227]|nr:hypothetical protein N0V88_007102 [Collariella sp. IMI 366227]